MAALTITVEPDELAGLRALAQVAAARPAAAARGAAEPDLAATAQSLLHSALEARLDEAGLPWAPPPEAVARRVSEAARPEGRLLALARSVAVQRYAASAAAVALLVVLWGGYGDGWQWTGFAGNGQLWDWLELLLLPVVVGTVPLWLRHSDHVSPARRRIFAVLGVVLVGFVLAGYLVPLKWTGFRGNTLWDWLSLVLLPVAVSMVRFVPRIMRSLRLHHQLAIAAVAVAWAVTVVGGYAWGWTWTGYEGNTLWDWLALLLLPLVVPVFLLPATLKWISDNAPGRPGRPGRRPVPVPTAARREA